MTKSAEALARALGAAPLTRRPTWGSRLASVAQADACLIAGAGLYVLTALALAESLDLSRVRIVWHAPVIGAALLCFLPLFLLVQLAVRIPSLRRVSRPQLASVLRIYLSPEALLRLAIVYLCLVPFGSAFSGLKQSLPTLTDRTWDAEWVALDRMIHLGSHPWEWLRPLLESSLALHVIDTAYMLWFPLLFVSVLGMAWSPDARLRLQFLLSALLTWALIGTVAAAALYSMGPCFLVDLGEAPASYHELMRVLRAEHQQSALFAIHNQAELLDSFRSRSWLPLGGLSAMPSVHVAFAMLLTLLSRRLHPIAGWIAGAYLVVIQVGSVVLAWHYAIDGYVGALAALGLWVGCGRVAAISEAPGGGADRQPVACPE
jgi:hypothetical protein